MKYRVDVDLANQTKSEFAEVIDGKDARLLNTVGAFSSLFLLDLSTYTNPVLVLKTEEPGSKQALAFAYPIGEIVPGHGEVVCTGALRYSTWGCYAYG